VGWRSSNGFGCFKVPLFQPVIGHYRPAWVARRRRSISSLILEAFGKSGCRWSRSSNSAAAQRLRSAVAPGRKTPDVAPEPA